MQVYVAMPTVNNPYPETIFNVMYQDVVLSWQVELLFDMHSITSRMPIHQARNELLRRFLQDTKADYIWFCDDDNPPSTDVLWKLLKHNKDICSAVVPLRLWDRDWDLLNIFKYNELWEREHITDLSEYKEPLQEIANCWTWCVLLSREFCEDIFNAFPNPFEFVTWEYISTLDNKLERYIWQDYEPRKHKYKEDYNWQIRVVKIPLSEDVCFFEKAKELWYKLYADISAECYHFNGRPSKRFISKHYRCSEQQ